jgi:hypothetical protein
MGELDQLLNSSAERLNVRETNPNAGKAQVAGILDQLRGALPEMHDASKRLKTSNKLI